MRYVICVFLLSSCGLAVNCAHAAEPVIYVKSSAETGASAAVVVQGLPLAQTSQLDARDAKGLIVGKGQIATQVEQVLRNLDQVLQVGGSSLRRSVKLNVYVTDEAHVSEVQQGLARQFKDDARPAVGYVVTTLPQPDALVAMDAIATIETSDTATSPRLAVSSKLDSALFDKADLPRMVAIPLGARVYISGQAEKAPTLSEATRLTLLSLEKSLQYCGLKKSDIVQVKTFLEPMAKVQDVNRELEAFFGGDVLPPVSHVEWESTLPIEIEVVAYAGKSAPDASKAIEFLTPPELNPSPVFSRIVRIQHPTTIFIGGLYGENGADGAQQVEQIFEQLGALLKETGSNFQHLVKATYYVAREEPSQKLNELRPKFYAANSPPAASKAQVRGVGRTGAGITLDMIAIPAK